MIVKLSGSRGKMCKAVYGRHSLVMDQPEEHGGTDRGPEPVVLLAAGLGGCIYSALHAFLSRRSLATEAIEVEVEMAFEDEPRRVGLFSVGVRLPPGVEDKLMKPLQRVVESCVVHHTLAGGARIEIDLERPED